MSAPTSAWMPFYVGDYLGDTQRLTTEQHGAYLLLILDYWRAGPPPDDDEVLRQITKLEAKAWKRHRPALARMFRIADGSWHHGRIDRELENAASNAERRSEKARAAAQARWEQSPKDAPSNARSNARSMPEAVLGECPPPSPSPVDAKASDGGKRARRLPDDWKPGPLPENVAALVAQWPPGREQRELEGFRDYWRSRPRDAARLDWDATWHNRIRDKHDSIIRENRNGFQHRNGFTRFSDGPSPTLAAAAEVRAGMG